MLILKRKKWWVISGVVFAALLIIITVILYFSGQDPVLIGGAGAVIAATAIETARLRRSATNQIHESQTKMDTLGKDIEKNHEDTHSDMNAVLEDVQDLSEEDKIEEGNDLFG